MNLENDMFADAQEEIRTIIKFFFVGLLILHFSLHWVIKLFDRITAVYTELSCYYYRLHES